MFILVYYKRNERSYILSYMKVVGYQIHKKSFQRNSLVLTEVSLPLVLVGFVGGSALGFGNVVLIHLRVASPI